MVKNLITAGQALRRITSREVSPIYCFFGEDFFFQEIIVDGILNVFKGGKTSLVLGVDAEEKILNHLNMTSLFSTKEVIIIRNPKKISVKYHDDIRDYCKSPSSDKVVIFIYEDPYASNKFIDSIASYSTSIDIRVPFPNKMREWISYYIKRKKINLSNNIIHELIEY